MLEGMIMNNLQLKNISFINLGHHPDDLVDAYLDYAEHANGVPLTDEEIEELNNTYPHPLYEEMLEAQIGNLESLADLGDEQ